MGRIPAESRIRRYLLRVAVLVYDRSVRLRSIRMGARDYSPTMKQV